MYGVTQGSVPGPLLFSLYMSPIASIIAQQDINHAQYADDTQLYVELRDGTDSAVQTCFSLLRTWFTTDGLSLNADKSEDIIFSSRQNSTSINQHTDINLADSKILVSPKIKSLGVTLDSSLTFANHIPSLCQKSNFHTRALRHIRNCLSDDDAKMLPVH